MPNPFNSETTVTIQNTNGKIQNSKLILYDVYGREVINLPISSSTIKLERGNLPSGIYFYKIMGDNISGVSGKIIVE